MADIKTLFVTRLYRAALQDFETLNAALLPACLSIAEEDSAGQAWSHENGYKGYTSYASLDDLTLRNPTFGELKQHLDAHARDFAKALYLDLGKRKLRLDSIWINVLEPGGVHTGHIHPDSALSGTYYVDMPKGASPIKFEDPRLSQMMAAPPRRPDAPEDARAFVYVEPKAGEVLMWESFVRHEAPLNRAKRARVSVSFNYGW